MIADRGSISPGDFDALADLFLGGPASVSPPAQGAPRLAQPEADGAAPASATVELLLFAHVPVMAASWATQYARHSHESHGAGVAVVRLGENHARVELVGVAEEARSADLAASIADARRRAGTLIVVPTAGAGLDIPSLITHAHGLTVMSTPDEAGMVAAYALLKRLASACEVGGVDGGAGPKPIRLVLVGAPADKARSAGARLKSAAGVFLHTPLDDRVCLERLGGGVPAVVTFDGPWIGTADGLMHDLCSPQASPRDDSAPDDHPAEPPSEAAPTAQPEDAVDSQCVQDTPVQTSPTVDIDPLPVDEPGSLLAFIPGLVGLPARCPHAPAVEIGVDRDGLLHAAFFAAPGDEGSAVQALLTAGAWAELNHRLLALVSPAGRGACSARTTLHLFTPQPSACRALLDTPLKVHVLVVVTRATDRVALELN